MARPTNAEYAHAYALHDVMMNISANIDIDSDHYFERGQLHGHKIRWLAQAPVLLSTLFSKTVEGNNLR